MVTAVSIYLLLGVLAIVAACCAWFNSTRRRAGQILRSVEAAISGDGRITAARWTSDCSIHLGLELRSKIFRNPSLKLDLHKPGLAKKILHSKPEDAEETLTFQADLDEPPAFNLEVGSQSCWGRSRSDLELERGLWDFVEAEPLVLSTSEEFDRDTSGTLSALIAARSQDFMDLRFQPRSPHFSASLPLEMLPKLAAQQTSLFALLSDLAREASTSKF